jgi:NADPH:quinone reductase
MQTITATTLTADLSAVRLVDAERRLPGPGEVGVRVNAAALNPVDWKLASGVFPGIELPHILGLDAAGIVEAVGEGVTTIRPGERVVWHGDLRRPGVFAEHAIAPAHVLARVPDGVESAAAAAIPCAGYTAFQGLVRKARIEEGQIVLVQGASGGVGGFAVQIARLFGATVIALARSEQADRVRGLGATHVLDYRDPELARQVKALTPGGYGADIMVEVVNPGDARKSLDLVRYNGQLVCIDPLPDLGRTPAYTYAASLHEVALGGAYAAGHRPTEEDFARMGDWFMARLVEGALDPMVTHAIRLGEIPDYLRRLKAGDITGKVVARL